MERMSMFWNCVVVNCDSKILVNIKEAVNLVVYGEYNNGSAILLSSKTQTFLTIIAISSSAGCISWR